MATKDGNKVPIDPAELSAPPPQSCTEKMKSTFSNFKYTSVLCCFKFKRRTNISALEFQIIQLKKKFGLDYLTLVGDNASIEDLKECLRVALEEINTLQGKIDDNFDQINEKELRMKRKMATMKSDKTLESTIAEKTNKPAKPHSKKNEKSTHQSKQKKKNKNSTNNSDRNGDDSDGSPTKKEFPAGKSKRESRNGQGQRRK